jgi:hypothetical protein
MLRVPLFAGIYRQRSSEGVIAPASIFLIKLKNQQTSKAIYWFPAVSSGQLEVDFASVQISDRYEIAQ